MNDLKPWSGRYGTWAGNPEGNPECKKRCVAVVYPSPGWISAQCARKRGFGPNGEYCKQHAKKVTDISLNNTDRTEGENKP